MDRYYNRPSQDDIRTTYWSDNEDRKSDFSELLTTSTTDFQLAEDYILGQAMQATVGDDDLKIYGGILPLPRAGNYGACDNFKAMRF